MRWAGGCLKVHIQLTDNRSQIWFTFCFRLPDSFRLACDLTVSLRTCTNACLSHAWQLSILICGKSTAHYHVIVHIFAHIFVSRSNFAKTIDCREYYWDPGAYFPRYSLDYVLLCKYITYFVYCSVLWSDCVRGTQLDHCNIIDYSSVPLHDLACRNMDHVMRHSASLLIVICWAGLWWAWACGNAEPGPVGGLGI